MIDSQLIFSNAQDIAGTSDTITGTNIVDLGSLVNHKGDALSGVVNVTGAMALNIVVTTALAGNTAVVTFKLFDHSTTTPSNGRQLITFAVTLGASGYPAGTQICSIPLPAMELGRYLGFYVQIANASLTGNVTAWIGPVHQQP